MTNNQSVSVVIPTYRPDKNFVQLIERLKKQTVRANKIIIVNTETGVFPPELKLDNQLEVHTISKREFDHGGTRDFGISLTDTEFVLFMTQDALPVDEYLIKNLLYPFSDSAVAVSYGRQLPNEQADPLERYTRSFNYSSKSRVKSLADLEELGIKTFFCSNVCALYRRSTYDKLGGFIKKTIFNEDMIMAGTIIKAGYKIAYQANAGVIHSHNFTGGQQFKRNFDLAVSQVQHPEVFAGIKSENEGVKLVKRTVIHFFRKRKLGIVVKAIYLNGCKFLGYRFGRIYRKLPKWLIIKLTSNREYWNTSGR